MATTTALSDVLDALCAIPGFGLKISGTIADDSPNIVTTDALASRLDESLDLEDMIAIIPGVTSAISLDRDRAIVSSSVSAATTTIITRGGNYAEDLGPVAVYLVSLTLEQVIRLANRAIGLLGRGGLTQQGRVPLRHGPDDADMQASNTTSWPDTSNVTITKQTTGSEIMSGARSTSQANSGAGGYSQSTTIPVGGPAGSNRLTVRFIAKDDTGGGAELAVHDQDGNKEDGIEFSSEIFVLGEKTITLDDTDRTVRLRLVGDGASEQVDWQSAWAVREGVARFKLPSWVRKRSEVVDIIVYHKGAAGYDADTWIADDLIAEALKPFEYDIEINEADVNQSHITITNESRLSMPLFVIFEVPADRMYGGSLAFTGYSDTSTVPADALILATEVQLAADFPEFGPAIAERESQAALTALLIEKKSNPAKRTNRFSGAFPA